MTRAIFFQALGDYMAPRRVLPWILLGFLAMGFGMIWNQLSPGDSLIDRYSSVSYILVFKVLALASAIFTTAIITAEVEQKTIVYLLTRPVPRWLLLIVRYLASVVVVALVAIIAALLASAGVYKGDMFSNPLLGKDILAIVVGAFAYGGLFLLVSLIFNRAMIICLLFAFGWESSVPNMPGDLFYASIYSHLQSIAQHPTNINKGLSAFGGSLNANTLSESTSLLVLLCVIATTLLAGAWWFTHFEYVPREDAE